LKELQDTLQSFCTILKKRKLDIKLGINIKDPKDYTFEDVLSIASKIYNKQERSSDTRSCMNAIQRCFRVVAKNESALTSLLSLAPTDVYGSVLSGGFTVILAVSFLQTT
jgi:hypothetical protein